jgi:adenylate cyclase
VEHFINILIIDADPINQRGLKAILSGGGNNVLFTDTIKQAIPIIQHKEIGILLINIDDPDFGGLDFLHELKEMSSQRSMYKLAITQNSASAIKLIKGLHEGAVDYITIPFNPNLVKAKVEVFKTLYYKDQRINQLLRNIFPRNVLEDLNLYNKFSPKRVENGVVLFTDFIEFSAKARNIKPIALLKKLDYYFSEFDKIVHRYKLEKVKTIGDAYMAIGGVTEDLPHPAVRAALAALEMRDFILNDKQISIATHKDFWDIRIGIHMGPLVAGIIGTQKMSFDVWGDTVNIAARAEQSSKAGHIMITEPVAAQIEHFSTLIPRGLVNIHKRGGQINMYYLDFLKKEFSMYGEGRFANVALRKICGLNPIDFEHMRKDIINQLKALLPEHVVYHDIHHTLNVEKAAIRYAKLEGLDEESIILLRTAVLYHDAGYILQPEQNEPFAIKMAGDKLPKFGYSNEQIQLVQKIIEATIVGNKPQNLLQKIMCDADHDYLGRPDYYQVATKLRQELENFGTVMTEQEWIDYQYKYMTDQHRYYTETAKNIRIQGKKARIAELKAQLNVR